MEYFLDLAICVNGTEVQKVNAKALINACKTLRLSSLAQ
jgi:hypothetical protein